MGVASSVRLLDELKVYYVSRLRGFVGSNVCNVAVFCFGGGCRSQSSSGCSEEGAEVKQIFSNAPTQSHFIERRNYLLA